MSNNSLYKTLKGQQVVLALYDSALNRWPVPFEELWTTTCHGETFAVVSGDQADPPLILLHGACSNALSWMNDIEAYSRHFRVYAVDIPGEPGHSAANRLDWNNSVIVDWLESFLSANQINNPILLGLSQGAWTALKYAVTRPENVRKLVLLAPAGITHDKFSFLLSAIFLSALGKRGAKAINRLTFGPEPVHPDAMEFMNAIMTHFKPRIGRLNLFSDKELSRLNMPVLLLGGQLDAIRDPQKIAARLKCILPKLSFHIFSDKGHVLVNTHAEILPFLLNL